jgi:asparagine synthase (glutamine-hydrolysing)
MSDTLASRGPDSHGSWVESGSGVGFGHRRLAIIDLSPAGYQPMASSDDRLVITFNGEIYNFSEIRSELLARGQQFRGSSDTEVLVEACRLWGVRNVVPRLNGIFAFALWDRQSRILTLARDHIGIKPLYWAQFGDVLVFGSELKAIRAFPYWAPELDRDAIAAFHQFGYIPSPKTVYRDVQKLKPGAMLTWRAGQQAREELYWDVCSVAARGEAHLLRVDDAEAIVELDRLLGRSVRRQMVSDVPLGALLSGGIDSSTIVALMQGATTSRVKTFSIGWPEASFNEAEYAKAIAAYLDTDHTELYVQPEDALRVIPEIPRWFDEPFADPSQIPTYLLSAMTRRHVTVALTGDGGDELFAGYPHYFQSLKIYRSASRLPSRAKNILIAALRVLPPKAYDRLTLRAAVGPYSLQLGHKVHRLASVLDASSPLEVMVRLSSRWRSPVVVGGDAQKAVLPLNAADQVLDQLSKMQLWDSLGWLPEDLLSKVDRASMAVSLEARVPLLAPEVIEFSWRLPSNLKHRNGKGKWLLRRVLERYVPLELFDRPKMGFGVPIRTWLRGPLMDWCEDLLDATRLKHEGVLDVEEVRKKWTEHKSGERNWEYLLWSALMFEAWHREWMSDGSAPRTAAATAQTGNIELQTPIAAA